MKIRRNYRLNITKIGKTWHNSSMSENEKILRSVDVNLRLESIQLTSAEKQTIMDCLAGKSSFDREIEKLSTRYQKVVA